MIPTETLCPVCDKVFLQKQRKQGGGRRSIYCSHRCCSLDWTRNNGGKRKAAILKYDHKVDSKAKKKERARATTLKRYHWTEENFQQVMVQQSGKCLGCEEPINRFTARIDHNHKTKKTRGLLCDHCNWAVGHVKDSPTTLRNLATYLEYFS